MRRPHPAPRKKPFWHEEPKVRWEHVVYVLKKAGRPLSIREVTERSGIEHRQDAHRRLERLRQRGVVDKVVEGSNVFWKLTDTGEVVYAQLFGDS